MAFIPVDSTAEVNLNMRLDGEQVQNTLYFRRNTGWDWADMLDLASNLVDWWTDFMAQELTSQIELVNIRIRDLTTQNDNVLNYTIGLPVGGTRGDEPLPNNVAFCISFRTNLAGRSFRGRNYIAGLGEDQVDMNTLQATFANSFVGAYLELFAVAAASSAEWVVVSRYANKLPRAAGVATPVTMVQYVDRTIDSMRTRLPGRGD